MEKINYKKINKDIIKKLFKFKVLLEKFEKFELTEHIRNEIESIQRDLGESLNITGHNKTSFNEIMDNVCTIDDCLHEIDMVSGDLIKDLNKLPEERKKTIYSQLGITEIPQEYEGLSEKLNDLLFQMEDITREILKDYLEYCG